MVALTRDTFSGIRAAYAVRSTAIGKEQEQDTNAFPRLLELARSRCKSLFTLKQIQELESMMQAIGCRSRDDGIPKTHTNALASQQTEKSEERDLKIGDSSGNTSVTTQLESDSTTENSANTRAEVGDEAEQPLNISVDLNLDGTSMEETVADSNIEGSLGLGGWFSYSPEQGDTQRCDDAKEERSHPTPSSSKIINSNENHNNSTLFSEGSCVEDKSNVLGSYDKRNASICKDSAFVSNFDPVKALTYYCERFAAKSQNLDTRLPSPTPSNEVVVENSLSEVSSTAGTNDHENKQSGKEDQVEFSKGTQPYLSVKDDASRGLASELALFPGSDAQTVEDGNTAGAQVKVVPMKGQKKSRDPRRRLDSQTIDLELPQVDTGGDEGLGPISVKQPTLQASQESLPLKDEFVSLLTFATGGWPSDAQARVLDKSSVADAVSQMLVDISSSLDDSSQRKRQVDFPIEESSGKRPRTAVILKEADVANLKASLAMEAFATRGDSKKGPLNESISSQLGLLKPKLASVMESMVNDLSKPRMKPRDPRRALLNSIVEKSKVPASGVAKGDASSSTALGAEAMTQMNREAIAGSVSQPAAFRSTIDKPDSMSNGAKGGTFSSEKTLGISSASVISQASGVVRNENHPSASSGGVLNDPMLISSNGRADDQSKMVKNSVVENKASVSKLLGRFDLNVSAVGNFKQRESMNHWDLEPLLEGLDEKQKQAVRQERARRIEEQSRMFVAKKLCLVLDLDHTLLNSAKFTEIEEEWETKLQANELTERSKFSKEGSNRRELYRFQHMGMWTKLRPGIWNFLARASHLYELHVYTMGNKAYATEMAKLLDPTGTLFAGRVISKGDDGDIVDGDERPPKSKDLDGVLGMESAVVIIDDSARVWPHHRHNLIVVERYMYFPCSRKQFGLPGPSLLEVGHDEREQDGMLASALAVIEKIHYNFFSNPRLHEVDVRDILAMEQRRVLSGCKLVFSRVFPQGEIQPHLHPLWQLAEQFGAACSMVIDEGVTHVVAISLGTEKVNWALATGRFVVRPSWVEASAILYRRANERDFLVTA
ncbi:hypothetical protein KP509_39G000800 [Ceratopteris richardii]|nr:hypothetical protein KP509_39G000800 [Ceratopteris richardii]